MDDAWTAVPGLGLVGSLAAQQAVAAARHAEALGFGSLWVAEDYFYPSAFPLAAAAAAVTERLVVATGVVNSYTRHPALLAMEAATVSVLAPGRFILGLGSSIRLWIEEQMGIPFVTPLATVEESVRIIRGLLAGTLREFAGRRFTVKQVELGFAPADRAMPIFLGVKGPRMLDLAGRIADGVLLSILTSPGHVRRARRQAGEARRTAGLEGSPFPLVAFLLVSIDGDGQRARELMRPTLARYLGSMHGQPFLCDGGVTPRETAPFFEALRAGRPAIELVSERLLDEFTISGTPAQCREALRRFAEAGLDTPAFIVPAGVEWKRQATLVGEHLVPFWKAIQRSQGAGNRETSGGDP